MFDNKLDVDVDAPFLQWPSPDRFSCVLTEVTVCECVSEVVVTTTAATIAFGAVTIWPANNLFFF